MAYQPPNVRGWTRTALLRDAQDPVFRRKSYWLGYLARRAKLQRDASRDEVIREIFDTLARRLTVPVQGNGVQA